MVSDPAAEENSAAKKISILLVDDHTILRRGLAELLQEFPDLVVVGEAADGQAAVDLVGRLQPQIVLMDVTMPGMDGIEATRRIKAQHPDIRVIGLSMHDGLDMEIAMRHAGAVAYVSKTDPPERLLAAIVKHAP